LKNFIISVDSSACFSKHELEKYGILMAHLSFTLNGIEHLDRFEFDEQKQKLYDKLSEGQLAQSAKANPDSFAVAWKPALEQGRDILHLSLSSKVSGSYESACQAARELGEKYERKIYVVDTLTGSYAISALAMDLIKLQCTATIEEAREFAQSGINQYNLIFTVGDIKHLYRGGRISHVKALLGGFLNLKPILFVNEEGRLTFLMNARGTRQAISLMVQKMLRSVSALTDCAYISHGGNMTLAETLKNKIAEALPSLNNFRIDYLTPVLGVHAGPGSLVLCFKGAARQRVLEDKPLKEILSQALHKDKQ
jgi:DegV family protein with EDD domain